MAAPNVVRPNSPEKREMTYPTKITVLQNGREVFSAEAGRLGYADSACRDFACFASPIIGAAYSHLACNEAAARIAESGYTTTILQNGVETTIVARAAREQLPQTEKPTAEGFFDMMYVSQAEVEPELLWHKTLWKISG